MDYKKRLRLRMVVFVLMSLSMLQGWCQQLAFPDAEGFGRYAAGGRKGTVYHVTNLNDSGTGSFRDAVSRPNRIIVFDVAGVIRLQSRLSVSKNFIGEMCLLPVSFCE